VKFIYSLVQDLNPKGRLTFTKTRDTQQGSPHFSVTLASCRIIPSAAAEFAPMGSAEGRPAQGAGMKPGDVIVQLGTGR